MDSQILNQDFEESLDKKFKVTWYGANRNGKSVATTRQQTMSAETRNFEILTSGDLVFTHVDTGKTYVISQGRYYIKEVQEN